MSGDLFNERPSPPADDRPVAPRRTAPTVVPISVYVSQARQALERQLPLAWISGEVSGCSKAPSGHLYFKLKDAQAQVQCVMYRLRNQHLTFALKDGMSVEVRASATLYEARGEFQLNVDALRLAGVGVLYERFARLKARLEAEGLFDPAAKREPPQFPAAIGVVTSLQAAALRDVLTTLARRNRAIPIIVYPVPVQGEGAAERIAAMLRRANDRAECDVLLLVRGGGSIEDLWPFNEERLARALRASRIPVVAGIGHETDFTIADFAADRRAPTPTAAAELASPARAELAARVAECTRCLSRDAQRQLGYAAQALDALARRLVHPAARLKGLQQDLVGLGARLSLALSHRIRSFHSEIEKLRIALGGLDPAAVLARGYSITRDASGRVLTDPAQVAAGETVATTLARGWLESEVRKKG